MSIAAMLVRMLIGICLVAVPSVSMANKPSDSYLEINVDDTLTVQWDIALRDLEVLIGLDSNVDGQITWGEVKQQRQKILDEAIPHLKILLDKTNLSLQPRELKVTKHTDGGYVVLELDAGVSPRFSLMEIDYSFFFDIDQTHRSVVSYSGRFGSGSYVITNGDESLVIPEGGTDWFYLTWTYIKIGAKHFWTNADHLFLIIALMLPSVWRFGDEDLKYVPTEKAMPAIVGLVWLVTCLTLAQWITLSHSVSDLVATQVPWVKTAMVALVVLSAIHNMYPVTRYWGVISVIAFGLLLGIGSGNFLIQQGLPSSMVPISLLGFSIGLELSQLVVAAALFPIAFLIRKTNLYDQFVFHGGSTLIVILGTIWAIERLSGASILRIQETIDKFL